MSEEEIIKNTKDFIEYLETDLDGNDENGIEWTLFPKDLDTIKGLLDLYKQEKEKNNNLIKQLQEQNTEIQDISRQLRQEKEKNKELEEHQSQYLDGELITAKQGKFFEKKIEESE